MQKWWHRPTSWCTLNMIGTRTVKTGYENGWWTTPRLRDAVLLARPPFFLLVSIMSNAPLFIDLMMLLQVETQIQHSAPVLHLGELLLLWLEDRLTLSLWNKIGEWGGFSSNKIGEKHCSLVCLTMVVFCKQVVFSIFEDSSPPE